MTIYGGEFWFINQQRVKVVNDGVKKKGNPFFFEEKWQGHLFGGKDIQKMWHVHFLCGADKKIKRSLPSLKMTLPLLKSYSPKDEHTSYIIITSALSVVFRLTLFVLYLYMV